MRLQRDHFVEAVGAEPPASLRIAPPRPAARAGRIDQHDVGLAFKVFELLGLAPAVEQAGLDGGVGAGRARGKFGQAAAVIVAGDDVGFWCCRRERQRFAPRPGAQVDDIAVVGCPASERDQLAALVLNLDLAAEEGRMPLDLAVDRKPYSPGT